MATPGLSVLLPCRDAADTLPEAIASLEQQSFTDFEVLAVDDGSADGTADHLLRWARRDRRVRVLRPGRVGLVEALNRAAARAEAPLLARMDADDVAHPRRFEDQVGFLAGARGIAASGTHVEMVADTEVGVGYRRYESWINAIESPPDVERHLFVECPLAHPTLVLRRSVFRALGGYRATGWAEDYDLVLRMAAAGARLANLPGEPRLRWRVRPDRSSLVAPEYSAAAFRRCKVHFLRLAFLPAGRDLAIWGAGRVGKPLARELIRQGAPVVMFVDLDPRKIGQRIHGAPVLSPPEFAALRGSDSRPYVLAAVGSPGVRGEIRDALGEAGLRELRDYRFCA